MNLADIHSVDVTRDASGMTIASSVELDGVSQKALKEYARVLLWRMFDADKNTEIASINLWLFKKRFTVADLKPLLTRWVGPHP